MDRHRPPVEVRPATVTDTGELLRAAGLDPSDVSALLDAGAIA
jgi:hypothetical protein